MTSGQEDTFRGTIRESVISRSVIPEITDELWAHYQAFHVPDLSPTLAM
jgi:hypothetical protein